MPLFVAHHAHAPDSCPVSRDGGAELLAHVSAANAARYGVAIQAEALIDDEHRLLVVLDAADRATVERFLAFLLRFGDLQVLPASSAEQAVGRGGCATGQEVVPDAAPRPRPAAGRGWGTRDRPADPKYPAQAPAGRTPHEDGCALRGGDRGTTEERP